MSWNRMVKVIERYERLVINEVQELKKLQKEIIQTPKLDTPFSRKQVHDLEKQLLDGLQTIMGMRNDLDDVEKDLFDTRIERIRRQIQGTVSMNQKLPPPKTEQSSYDFTIEEETNPYEEESRRYQASMDVQQLEKQQVIDEMKARAEASAKLAKDMEDLQDIFTELQTIVHEQHDMVDSIEEHIERANLDVKHGKDQLKRAVQDKTAKVPIVAAIVGGLAVGGPVGVAAGSAVAGVAAGVGGLVAGIYGGKWFKNSVKKDLD